METVIPECTFESAPFADILDGMDSLSVRSGHGALVPAPGTGPDTPLAWAIQEVTKASQTNNESEVVQLCTNALLNSRRALSCLVDWYIRRDLANICRNPPRTARDQAEFLMSRRIIDELTSHVLERAVDKRNRVEHEYIAPELDKTEDVVELLRRTITTLSAVSDPERGPFMFGHYLGGTLFKPGGTVGTFNGWSGPIVIFCRFGSRPWVGVLTPEDCRKALVRRAFLNEIDRAELVELLSLAEQKYGQPSSFSDLGSCKVMLTSIGVMTSE